MKPCYNNLRDKPCTNQVEDDSYLCDECKKNEWPKKNDFLDKIKNKQSNKTKYQLATNKQLRDWQFLAREFMIKHFDSPKISVAEDRYRQIVDELIARGLNE